MTKPESTGRIQCPICEGRGKRRWVKLWGIAVPLGFGFLIAWSWFFPIPYAEIEGRGFLEALVLGLAIVVSASFVLWKLLRVCPECRGTGVVTDPAAESTDQGPPPP